MKTRARSPSWSRGSGLSALALADGEEPDARPVGGRNLSSLSSQMALSAGLLGAANASGRHRSRKSTVFTPSFAKRTQKGSAEGRNSSRRSAGSPGEG